MTFFEHYRDISDKKEKRVFRKKIIETCKIEYATFYSWLYRKKIPALAQSVIADLMRKPVEELFPEN